ncbi:MAG: hypothetical protein AABZ80_11060, partial [Gemmatimonadota bacterium]
EKKVRLDGSAPVTIANGGAANGVAWTETDEIIVGATGSRHGLSRVSAAGGELAEFTTPDSSKGTHEHVWPVVAPDNNTVVFAAWSGSLITSELATAALSDGTVVPLGIKGIRPLAILDGVVIYLQADGAVMAVPFDAKRKRVGKAIPVHDPVPVVPGNNGNSGIFISRNGAMVSARGGGANRLVWSDRRGALQPLPAEARGYFSPRISPDARHIAVGVSEGQRNDVWIYDVATTTLSRLTTMETVSSLEWTPDSKWIVFTASGQQSRNAVWMQLAAGGAAPMKLVENTELTPSVTRSPDGKWLIQQSLHESSWDLTRIPLDSPTVRVPFLATPLLTEAAPTFSPNGRWVAMVDEQSDRFEVYVRSFPDPSVRVQVSVGGGTYPQWAADGNSLYYTNGTLLLRAKVTTTPAFRVTSRDTVRDPFVVPSVSGFDRSYDVARDGQRVLMLSSNRDDFQLVVAPNWRTELRRRLVAAGHSVPK